MKTLTGSEKQIKWANSLKSEYLRLVSQFGGIEVDCEDAKFWIENAQVTNINYNLVPAKLEAYNFLRSPSFIDATRTSIQKYIADGLDKEAAMMIYRGDVK